MGSASGTPNLKNLVPKVKKELNFMASVFPCVILVPAAAHDII